MSQFFGRVLKPVLRKDAERYFRLNLLSFAASVTFTRFFLMATGYPQLGNETLHIAHVLYGGVLLYIGSLIPLIYANRWAYNWSSVLSGIGVGLFIDEVGKFMTQNNDYFFPAAAPIIYAFFLIFVLIYTRVTKGAPANMRMEFYAVSESFGRLMDRKIGSKEHGELKKKLQRIKRSSSDTDLVILSDRILEFVDSKAINIVPDEADLFGKTKDWFQRFEERWLSQSRIRLLVTVGLLLFGLAGSIRLFYYYSGGPASLELLLRDRVADLSVVTSVSLFWAKVQLVMEGLVGLCLLLSATLLSLGRDRIGLGLGSIGMLFYLVGVNLIQFYIDQFSTVLKAFIQFLFLQIMYYYRRRFHTG
jgi:hypothetical protein